MKAFKKAAAVTASVFLIISTLIGCFAIRQVIIVYEADSVCYLRQASKPLGNYGILFNYDRAFVFESLSVDQPAVITRGAGGTSPALNNALYLLNNKSWGLGLSFLLILIIVTLFRKRMLKYMHACDGMK